jgi:aryl-alcohol dehydrogenase-like predicted oxidoreductase
MPLSIQGRPDEATARAVLHASLDAGVTLIDTADVYCLDQRDLGHNERLIAAALAARPGPLERIVVATKGGLTRPGGAWERDGSPAHLRRACERSLRALGVEQIALYQLHAPDPAVRFEESVATLAALQREGKIRWVGLSNVSVAQIEAAEAIVPVATVQNRLNPFFREAITEGVVAYCGQRNIGFLAYSPVGGGRLNQKLAEHPVLQRLAARLQRSPHAIVTAWVLAQGPTVFAIPGARSVPHAQDAARAADLVLSAEDLQAINEAEFDRR